MKKILCVLVACVILMSTTIVFASAATASTTWTIDSNRNAFTVNYYFDNDKGIIQYSYNKTLVDEVGIKVLHTTNSHWGTVSSNSNNNATNTKSAGIWTNRADVRAHNGKTATFIANY